MNLKVLRVVNVHLINTQWSRGPLSTPIKFLPTLIPRTRLEDNIGDYCDADGSRYYG